MSKYKLAIIIHIKLPLEGDWNIYHQFKKTKAKSKINSSRVFSSNHKKKTWKNKDLQTPQKRSFFRITEKHNFNAWSNNRNTFNKSEINHDQKGNTNTVNEKTENRRSFISPNQYFKIEKHLGKAFGTTRTFRIEEYCRKSNGENKDILHKKCNSYSIIGNEKRIKDLKKSQTVNIKKQGENKMKQKVWRIRFVHQNLHF